MTVQPANAKKTTAYPCRPTAGRKVAAIEVDTAWFTRRAMLIPFERMRVGISSERASHTQTPGPAAKKAMKQKVKAAVSQPICSLGIGVTSAFSILRGAVRAASRFANGFEKKATTLLEGTQLSRVT